MTLAHRKPFRLYHLASGLAIAAVLSGCTIPAATQALIDEYNNTIPTCTAGPDCQAKWQAARIWVTDTATYGIRVANDDRIETYDADSTRAGTAAQVVREPLGDNRYRILVNIDCYAISGCPPFWETKIEFNRLIGGVRP